jgi:hypothetical protein
MGFGGNVVSWIDGDLAESSLLSLGNVLLLQLSVMERGKREQGTCKQRWSISSQADPPTHHPRNTDSGSLASAAALNTASSGVQ